MADARSYLPAAGHDWILPLYDPLVRLLGGNPTRAILVGQAAIRPHHRVLEIGCGTGSLLVAIKQLHPEADVTGLDPDAKALARARRKAERAGVSIRLDQAFADNMPYPDATFDRVLSSFMFHHLQQADRERALREARRVLEPGGTFHMLDFAGADTRGHGRLARLIHSSHQLDDNSEERVLSFLSRAGFTDTRTVLRSTMRLGHIRINYYQASVPADDREHEAPRVDGVSASPKSEGSV